MIKRIGFHISIIFFLVFGVRAQSSLSFYHLGNATYQNSSMNPAFVPNGKVFLGLPALSGVHLNINNKFSYHDFVVQGETQKEIDLNTFLKSLQQNNMLHAGVNINLFHLGFSGKPGQMLSFFANERIETDLLYTKQLMEFAIEGNRTMLDETVALGRTKFDMTYYREYGMSFASTIGRTGASFGVRAKFLQGIANASTDPKFKADLITNIEDYSLGLELENATLCTSGIEVLKGNTGNMGTYLINNSNRGASLDLGLNWEMNRRVSLSASLLDLGFISWKEGLKNHTMTDTSMVYIGVNLKHPRGLEKNIKDSLINRFKNRKTEVAEAYSNILSPKVYFGGAYRMPNGGELMGTAGARYVMGQMKMLFGAGYKHNFSDNLVASVNVTKLPQQFFNVGAAVSMRGGPLQVYLAADQLLLYDMTRFQSIDLRIGVNFIFGRHSESSILTAKTGSSNTRQSKGKGTIESFVGAKKVRVKGKKEIYTIIGEQERRSKSQFEQKGNPMPTFNPNLNDVSTSPPVRNSKNRNLNHVDSAPPANTSNQSGGRGAISVKPVKPSKNRNLNKVKSGRPANTSNQSGGRGYQSVKPVKPSKNRNLRNVSSAPPANISNQSSGGGAVRSSPPVKPSRNKNLRRFGSRTSSAPIPSSSGSGRGSVQSAPPVKPSKNRNFGNFTRKSKPIPGGSNRSKVRKPRKEKRGFRLGKK